MQITTVQERYRLSLEPDEQFDVYHLNGEKFRVNLIGICWRTPHRPESFTLRSSSPENDDEVFGSGRIHSFTTTDDFAMPSAVAAKVQELLKTRPKPAPQEFPLTPVLALATGRLLEPREDGNGMLHVMRLVEFMTGNRIEGMSPSKQQREDCRVALIAKYGWLDNVQVPDSREADTLAEWVDQVDREHNDGHWMIAVDAV